MPLKVLSYNIREGGRFRLRALARVICAQQPDAVALLEATATSARGYWRGSLACG